MDYGIKSLQIALINGERKYHVLIWMQDMLAKQEDIHLKEIAEEYAFVIEKAK